MTFEEFREGLLTVITSEDDGMLLMISLWISHGTSVVVLLVITLSFAYLAIIVSVAGLCVTLASNYLSLSSALLSCMSGCWFSHFGLLISG